MNGSEFMATGLYPHRACCCCIPSWNRPYWAIPSYITNIPQECPRGTVFVTWNLCPSGMHGYSS